MRIWLAIRCFFVLLFDAEKAKKIREVLDGAIAARETKPEPAPAPKPIVPAKAPVRSEALTLLATLQREARLLDIVQEPLGAYSDAQVGAAAREVLRNCATVIERLFAPQPALIQDEGSVVEVPRGYDPMRFKMVGNVSGEPPFQGRLVHHGWVASRCELPSWTGNPSSAMVLAPIEVEIEPAGAAP
jgi:hypothetical protein